MLLTNCHTQLHKFTFDKRQHVVKLAQEVTAASERTCVTCSRLLMSNLNSLFYEEINLQKAYSYCCMLGWDRRKHFNISNDTLQL